MYDKVIASRRNCIGIALLALLTAPAAALAQSFQVYTDKSEFLAAAAQAAEKIETDDFSEFDEGEVNASGPVPYPVTVLDHLRVSVLDGLNYSINYPGSPGRDTRLFFDDVTTENAYDSAAIRFGAQPESPDRARHVLRPVEVDANGQPVSPLGSINSGNIRFRLVSGRVRGFGLDLEGVHIDDASVLLVRFFDQGTDLYLDIPAGENGNLFYGIITDQPFDVVQLWAGRIPLAESVQVASVVTAFTDPPVELGCLGDTNWDNLVDLDDLDAILMNFGDRSGVLGVEGGDVNGDHIVDLNDLDLLLARFGYTGCGDGGGQDGGDGGGDGNGGDDGSGGGGDDGDGNGDGDDGDGSGGGGGDDGGDDGGGDGNGGDGPPPSHGG